MGPAWRCSTEAIYAPTEQFKCAVEDCELCDVDDTRHACECHQLLEDGTCGDDYNVMHTNIDDYKEKAVEVCLHPRLWVLLQRMMLGSRRLQ